MGIPDFWLCAIPPDHLNIVVHVRNADDVQALVDENQSLKTQVKKLEQDIYTWSTYSARYMEALDDLRALRRICKKHGIDFDFRSLK